jgi:chitinase
MNAFHNIRLFIIIGSFIITHVNALECDAVKLCANNACCSQWNFCGTGDAWCGAGCLSGR